MAYTPQNVPSDPAQLPDFLRSEFQRLAQELTSGQPVLRVAQTNATPTKPRAGDVRYADGVNFDADGTGVEGFYWHDGTNWNPFSTTGGPYDTGGYYPGVPAASTLMMRHVFVRAVDFPANLTDSKASAATAATAQTDFDLQKNGVSFGTMRFAAAATTCTFVGVGATSFAATDVLTVVSAATPDATLADVAWMFKGVRA